MEIGQRTDGNRRVRSVRVFLDYGGNVCDGDCLVTIDRFSHGGVGSPLQPAAADPEHAVGRTLGSQHDARTNFALGTFQFVFCNPVQFDGFL